MNGFVVPHDPQWVALFDAEATAITAALTCPIETVHIGSTAISGILAKPVIDVLGIVDDLRDIDAQSEAFVALGYEVMGAFGIDGRRYFRKLNAAGLRTHHLHIYEIASPHMERHVAFRDYLRAHPEIAAAYSALKASLTSEGCPDWGAYMDGKAPFIERTERDAVRWFRRTR